MSGQATGTWLFVERVAALMAVPPGALVRSNQAQAGRPGATPVYLRHVWNERLASRNYGWEFWYSEEDLAVFFGVDLATIRAWGRGREVPAAAQFEDMALSHMHDCVAWERAPEPSAASVPAEAARRAGDGGGQRAAEAATCFSFS